MRVYTVHAPPDGLAAPERFKFVKDGFSWPALFVPLLWIVWHRLWLTLMGYVIFVLVVMWIALLLGDGGATAGALLGAVLFAFEANTVRRASLLQRGWRELGGSSGRRILEAELRFFENRDSRVSPAVREDVARRSFQPTRASDVDDPVLGLFPEPEH
jgi:hypothetical protein